MKLVREYIILEKFEEDNIDPITSMGIGTIQRFKNLIDTFHTVDPEKYVYTIYVQNDFIDFWFNHPFISKLSKEEQDKLFEYVKNAIKKLGYEHILIKPKLIMHIDKKYYEKTKEKIYLPGIVRFNVISAAKNMIRPAEYRRAEPLSIKFYKYENAKSGVDYEYHIKKYKDVN